jgi:predicted esterase YcpF (UPF0227 family)
MSQPTIPPTIPSRRPPPRRGYLEALLPVLTALLWFWAASSPAWRALALLPALGLAATGVLLLWSPGDERLPQNLAISALVSFVFALLGGWQVLWVWPWLLLGSMGSYLVAGRLGTLMSNQYDPAPADTPTMWRKTAIDEALMGYFLLKAKIPTGTAAIEMGQAAERAESFLQSQGWLDDPRGFLPSPPPIAGAEVHQKRIGKFTYEEHHYDSHFIPHPELPESQSWQQRTANRRALMRVFRQPEAGRPWLVCIHGYRMGAAWMDLSLFRPSYYVKGYGFNLVQPVLPLHGIRAQGRSGDGYLDHNLLNLLHAQSQALWDLQRSIEWIRTQEPHARIGVLGISLGGYNASLLASRVSGLDLVIAGIPVVDFASALNDHMPPLNRQFYAENGLSAERFRRILQVVSPLSLPPLLPPERLTLFAANGDRVVTPDQPLRLAQHWGVPVQWYEGGHLSIRSEKSIGGIIHRGFRGAGWVG